MIFTPESLSEDRPRLVYLDSLRGLAALWVFFFHMIFLAQPNLAIPEIFWPLRVGGMGVTLFFIISAFCLCLTMPRHIQNERWLLSFYTHRACRILPLFYTVLAINTYFLTSRGVDVPLDKILINVTCLFNFIPGEQTSLVMAGWVIGVEVIIYAIFPILYKFFNTLSKSIILFIVSWIIGVLAKQFITDHAYYQWSILRHFPIFTGGIVLFYAIEKIQNIDLRFRNLLGWTLCLSFIPTYKYLDMISAIPGMAYYAQLIPFGLLLTGLSITPLPVLVSYPAALLGKMSYSVYLLHPLVIIKTMHVYPKIYALDLGVTVSFALCACLTLSVLLPLAYISYVYIEKPGIDLGKWLVRREWK